MRKKDGTINEGEGKGELVASKDYRGKNNGTSCGTIVCGRIRYLFIFVQQHQIHSCPIHAYLVCILTGASTI